MIFPRLFLETARLKTIIPVHLDEEQKRKLNETGYVFINSASYFFPVRNLPDFLIARQKPSTDEKIIVCLIYELNQGRYTECDDDYKLYKVLASGLYYRSRCWRLADFDMRISLQALLLTVPRGTNLYNVFVKRGILQGDSR